MKTYELTYIITSEASPQEAETAKNEIESFVQSKDGIVVTSEKMGAQPLAYPIKKTGSGYFNVLTFQVGEDKIEEIKDNFAKNSKVLRSIITVKKPVKGIKERRTRKSAQMMEFEITKRKPLMAEMPAKEEQKKGEKVDTADLDKKLNELLSE